MNDLHRIYLNLGSNIHPEVYLPKAIRLLCQKGAIQKISRAWESHALGTTGPNFINVTLEFLTPREPAALKNTVIRPIERALKRVRNADKNTPRTIDIDIILADGQPVDVRRWSYPFVIVPTADLLPNLIHPTTGERLAEAAKRTIAAVWIEEQPNFPDLWVCD